MIENFRKTRASHRDAEAKLQNSPRTLFLLTRSKDKEYLRYTWQPADNSFTVFDKQNNVVSSDKFALSPLVNVEGGFCTHLLCHDSLKFVLRPHDATLRTTFDGTPDVEIMNVHVSTNKTLLVPQVTMFGCRGETMQIPVNVALIPLLNGVFC